MFILQKIIIIVLSGVNKDNVGVNGENMITGQGQDVHDADRTQDIQI